MATAAQGIQFRALRPSFTSVLLTDGRKAPPEDPVLLRLTGHPPSSPQTLYLPKKRPHTPRHAVAGRCALSVAGCCLRAIAASRVLRRPSAHVCCVRCRSLRPRDCGTLGTGRVHMLAACISQCFHVKPLCSGRVVIARFCCLSGTTSSCAVPVCAIPFFKLAEQMHAWMRGRVFTSLL